MNKNFGSPPVSGYSDASGRAWETVVYQAGKPVTDRELNLSQDVDVGAAQNALRQLMPSGWIADDPLSTASPSAGIFTASALTNTLVMPNNLLAHVNGWLIRVKHTGASNVNQVALGAGPSGAGQLRTDLVILEVWRRLITVSPSTAGKSATGRIWQEGNVTTAPSADTTLNFADDLLDGALATETTSRVQIQYRLRVINDVDLLTSPSGMTSPNVLARTVPVSAVAFGGNATTFAYENQSASIAATATGDPGLWRAGDGDPANGLGTVDGFMYAIPLVAVTRRNSAAFSRTTNQNGAGTSPAASGRPDGLFNNIIVAGDVVDLRHCVSASGWSLPEVLEKNVNLILDNAKRTELVANPFGGGSVGTSVFMCNELGGTPSPAGPNPVQQFDAVRRRFSARPIVEMTTATLGGVVSTDGVTVTFNPSSCRIYPYLVLNWASVAPANTMLVEIVEMHWARTDGVTFYADALPHVESITGLGTSPATSVSIKFGNTVSALGLTAPFLYVTFAVSYPPGNGLSHTPVGDYGLSSFELTTSAAALTPAPMSFLSFTEQTINAVHREVRVEYRTSNLTIQFGSGPTPLAEFWMQDRVYSVTSLTVNLVPAGFTVDPYNGRRIIPDNPIPANAAVSVTYSAVRPMPQQTSPQMAIYFRTAAPQMARSDALGTTLSVIPRLASEKLYTLTVGAGSDGEAYPFPLAYVQTGGIFPTTPLIPGYLGEVDMLGSAEVSVGNFDADTGFLSLPVLLPMAASPGVMTLQRTASDNDIEGRSYFTSATVNGGGYRANAFAQDLSAPDRHKNIYPVLAELADNHPLGPKGMLVLLLFIRYAAFDDDNGVFLTSDLNANTTSVAVYRVKGLLLNKRGN